MLIHRISWPNAVYSMMVPPDSSSSDETPRVKAGVQNTSLGVNGDSSFLREALPELERSRNEIVSEVHRAPARRVDNVTTHLHDSALLLRMHATVLNAVRKEYLLEVAKHGTLTAAAALSLGGLCGAALMSGLPTVAGPLAVAAVVVTGGGYWYTGRVGAAKASFFLDGPGLDEAFRRTHYMEVSYFAMSSDK